MPQTWQSTEKLLPENDVTAEMEDEDPPKNFVGTIMKRSVVDPRKYYCGQRISPAKKPAFICDPEKGRQCGHCKKGQRFIEKTDASRPKNAIGDPMKRGSYNRANFYCGKNGCGPDKGPQCLNCTKTQDEICLEIAQWQATHIPDDDDDDEEEPPAQQSMCGFCGCCACCLEANWEICKLSAKADAVCCKCCLESQWELCKCCVKAQELCCQACCRCEVGFMECYFQCLLHSARLCWHAPGYACIFFTVLEIVFFWATLQLPSYLKTVAGDVGFVWGFILVVFVLCCFVPCCAACAPCAILGHEARRVRQQVVSFESRFESLADTGAGLADRLHDMEDVLDRQVQKVESVAEDIIHPSCLGRNKK